MQLALISHALCPYVQRVAIVAAEKDLPLERIDIDLRAKPDWFLALSPEGRTPVLRAGDAALFESAAICEYLEDTAGPGLHPQDPLQRARHRAWMQAASSMLDELWRLYTARDEAGFSSSRDALAQRLRRLEGEVAGPYFGGARFSMADAAFGPALRYFEVFDAVLGADLFGALPKVATWRAALARRPSVRQAVAPDYAPRLRAYVIEQGGVLGARLTRADPTAL